MGLQALKPSMREKKRYLCFKTKYSNEQEITKHILSRIKQWIGEKNYTLGRVHFIKTTFKNNKGIISCNHKECSDVKTGITLAKDTEVIYVSGSLKKAKDKLGEA